MNVKYRENLLTKQKNHFVFTFNIYFQCFFPCSEFLFLFQKLEFFPYVNSRYFRFYFSSYSCRWRLQFYFYNVDFRFNGYCLLAHNTCVHVNKNTLKIKYIKNAKIYLKCKNVFFSLCLCVFYMFSGHM